MKLGLLIRVFSAINWVWGGTRLPDLGNPNLETVVELWEEVFQSFVFFPFLLMHGSHHRRVLSLITTFAACVIQPKLSEEGS